MNFRVTERQRKKEPLIQRETCRHALMLDNTISFQVCVCVCVSMCMCRCLFIHMCAFVCDGMHVWGSVCLFRRVTVSSLLSVCSVVPSPNVYLCCLCLNVCLQVSHLHVLYDITAQHASAVMNLHTVCALK